MSQQQSAGWYPANDGSRWHRWHDGNKLTEKRRSLAPESPWLWVFAGFMTAFGALVVAFFGASTASLNGANTATAIALLFVYAAFAAAWLMVMVGVIALGVRLGMRHAHAEHPPD